MKNQYFGDSSDYRKYGLLRALAGAGGLKIGVAWMLTPDDGRPDGGRIRYLSEPGQWRKSDPELFDFLSLAVTPTSRGGVSVVESASLIPGAVFHSDVLADDATSRAGYMETMLDKFRGLDLVFFDPDNGMEVKSCPIGRAGSSKYLAYGEARRIYEAGMSLLIFQHFGRVSRESFIPMQMDRLQRETGAAEVVSVATSHVLFLFALHQEHADAINRALMAFRERWGFKAWMAGPVVEAGMLAAART